MNVQGLNPVQSGSELIPVSNSGSLSLTGQEALCACRQDSQQQIPQPQQQKPKVGYVTMCPGCFEGIKNKLTEKDCMLTNGTFPET